MIRSMTGYGRAAFELGGSPFDVEVRAVNHRFLDLRVRLPRPLAGLEPAVRERVQQRFARGKVDLSVAAPGAGPVAGQVEVDEAAVRRYVDAAQALEQRFGLDPALSVESVLGLPGVSRVIETELDAGEAGPVVLAGVDEALAGAAAMRDTEGQGLDREFRERLSRVEALLGTLDGRAGSVQDAVRERLRKRTRELEVETGLLDEARLHQEIVLAADRLDVAEEISRLRSHVAQFVATLDAAEAGGAVGRRLDFLLQELGREANTIGSKANDAEMAHSVVELKTELERIREQVQNVE